uniref:TF-B3 domain-containing protein n=2 Tax=Kalanchoe fedtschenkoi TaxID=63787 RepID=A0A7N0TQT9_KALFE
MDAEVDNLPEFFKVYFADHSFKQMKIPRAFEDYMDERKFGTAELAGRSGQTWLVEVDYDGKDLYFTDGWQAFVEDNMVQDGDFLFFKLLGNLMFSFIIYDETMCEKEAAFNGKCSRGRDGVVEAVEEPMGLKPVKRRNMGCSQPEGSLFTSMDKTAVKTSTSVKPSFEKHITISNIEHGHYLRIPSYFAQEHSLNYKSNEKMVLRTSRNSSWKVNIINRGGEISLCRGWAAFARENNLRLGDVCNFELVGRLEMLVHVTHQDKVIEQKQLNVAAPKIRPSERAVGVSQPKLRQGSPITTERQKAAGRSRPSLVKPSFVALMKKHHVEKSALNIPAWFFRENSLHYERNEKMVLRSEKDSLWLLSIIHSKYNNKTLCRLSGGWIDFVRDNNIKEGDTCKFELVNRLEMKFHIMPRSKQD